MKKMICEICGESHLLKKDGVFECQNCGTRYTLDEAKKLFLESEDLIYEKPNSLENGNTKQEPDSSKSESSVHFREGDTIESKTTKAEYSKPKVTENVVKKEKTFNESYVQTGKNVISASSQKTDAINSSDKDRSDKYLELERKLGNTINCQGIYINDALQSQFLELPDTVSNQEKNRNHIISELIISHICKYDPRYNLSDEDFIQRGYHSIYQYSQIVKGKLEFVKTAGKVKDIKVFACYTKFDMHNKGTEKYLHVANLSEKYYQYLTYLNNQGIFDGAFNPGVMIFYGNRKCNSQRNQKKVMVETEAKPLFYLYWSRNLSSNIFVRTVEKEINAYVNEHFSVSQPAANNKTKNTVNHKQNESLGKSASLLKSTTAKTFDVITNPVNKTTPHNLTVTNNKQVHDIQQNYNVLNTSISSNERKHNNRDIFTKTAAQIDNHEYISKNNENLTKTSNNKSFVIPITISFVTALLLLIQTTGSNISHSVDSPVYTPKGEAHSPTEAELESYGKFSPGTGTWSGSAATNVSNVTATITLTLTDREYTYQYSSSAGTNATERGTYVISDSPSSTCIELYPASNTNDQINVPDVIYYYQNKKDGIYFSCQGMRLTKDR